jgi:hypothetical protein
LNRVSIRPTVIAFVELSSGPSAHEDTMDKARKALLLAIAVVGAASVGLQGFLDITRHNLDHSLAWRTVDFLSFFTVSTAIFAAAAAAVTLLRPDSRLARPGVTAATAVYMLVVAVTYEWLLRGEHHGLDYLANLGLHDVLPALVILLWLAFTPKRGLSWREPLAWLIYPAAYIAWTLIRGAAIHRYPYFFADVDKLGYPRALVNGAGFLAAFWLLGMGAVAVGRLRLAANKPAIETPQASL